MQNILHFDAIKWAPEKFLAYETRHKFDSESLCSKSFNPILRGLTLLEYRKSFFFQFSDFEFNLLTKITSIKIWS